MLRVFKEGFSFFTAYNKSKNVTGKSECKSCAG